MKVSRCFNRMRWTAEAYVIDMISSQRGGILDGSNDSAESDVEQASSAKQDV